MSQVEKPKPLKEPTVFKATPQSSPASSDHEDEGWKSRKGRKAGKKNKAPSKSSKSLSLVPDSDNVEMIDTSSDQKKKLKPKLPHMILAAVQEEDDYENQISGGEKMDDDDLVFSTDKEEQEEEDG